MSTKTVASLLFALLVTATGGQPLCAAEVSAEFEAANRLYEQGKYAEAEAGYQKLVDAGSVSSALYFNLGNACFKSGKIGRALAAYRRAERLAPRDPDIRANLQFARNHIQGPTLVPTRWQRWLGTLTLDEWARLAAAAFWLFFLLLAAGQWRPEWRRRLNVYAAMIGGAFVVLCACLLLALHEQRPNRAAIVVAPEAVVRQGPLEDALQAFVANDGAELEVLDRKDNWLQVGAGKRQVGWIKSDAVMLL